MKVLFLSLLVVLAGLSASAQDDDSFDGMLNAALGTVAKSMGTKTGKIAVMDFPAADGSVTGLSNYISNRAINQMLGSGKEVVDRNHLHKVVKEQKLQQSALMDAATAAKVGRLAGAQYFLIGNYTRLPRTMNINVRLLSVETSQYVASQEVSVPLNGDNQPQIEALLKTTGTKSKSGSLDDKSSDAQPAAAAAPAAPATDVNNGN